MDNARRSPRHPQYQPTFTPLKISLITLGHRMPSWVTDGTRDYGARMPREFQLEIRELKAAPRQEGRTRDQILSFEADHLTQALDNLPYHALDERGASWSSMELAQQLDQSQQISEHLAFVIGSADGLHPRILAQSRTLLSLSRFTLPHGLARLVLVEQLYRAAMILKGHPYHRDS